MAINSPEKTVNQVLGVLPIDEVKTFLLECVNLPWSIEYPDYRPHFERWLSRWQRIFTFKREDKEGEWQTIQIPREHLELFAPIVRTTLCRLWVEQDARQRDWYFYRLRDAHRQMIRHLEGWDENAVIWGGPGTVQRLMDYALQDVPRICPFEAAVYWLQNNQGLMRRCAGPMCAAPYFFRTEKGQKFCSPECADPARREAKLRWWNESPNSPKNRAKRKTSASKKAFQSGRTKGT